METGILREYFNELFIKTPQGIFSLCKGSDEALRSQKEKYVGKPIRYFLLPSNKAVCSGKF
jgi:hypothetical protein